MLNKKILRYIKHLTIILALSILLVMSGPASAAGNAVVSISVPAGDPNAGQQFTISIAVEPNNAIAGMQFNLSYDPGVVTVNSVTEGNLLNQGGASTYFNNGQINNTTGTITGVFGAITSPGQTVATAGAFAVISMTAGSAAGSSPLTPSGVIIGDVASQPLPVSVINDDINITASVPSPPPAGGNNPGSPAGGPGGTAGVTNLHGLVGDDGLMLEDAIATDTDFRLELHIAQGTYVRNKYGQPLTSLTITPQVENQSPAPGSVMVSQAYEIEPDGATFNEAATLVFRYSVMEIPAGIPVENLYIALWDPASMTWTDLGGIVDDEAGTVSVPINHLSIYALMAHNRPASMAVRNFVLTPDEVEPGETVTASIEVRNQGDLTGTYDIILTLDDAVMQTRTVTVDGGSSEAVVFNLILDTVGEHRVGLGGLTATFVVKGPQAPATFTLNRLEIKPVSVNAGEKVNIAVFIENTGDLEGTHLLTLSVDEVIVEIREITLDGHGSLTESFSIIAGTVGEHTVSIGTLQGVYQVSQSSQPAGPEISGLELNGFSTTPGYDEVTNTLEYVRIRYQMNQAWISEAGARMVMIVLFDGEPLEQVSLFDLRYFTEDGTTGEFNYIPAAGWMSGEYTFQAELYDGENLIQETLSHSLLVSPEAVTKVVSWWTLGAVIGIATLLIIVLLVVVIYRRRDMLRS